MYPENEVADIISKTRQKINLLIMDDLILEAAQVLLDLVRSQSPDQEDEVVALIRSIKSFNKDMRMGIIDFSVDDVRKNRLIYRLQLISNSISKRDLYLSDK